MVKRPLAAALLVSVLASPLGAGEHLVTSSQMHAALAERPRQRAAHIAQLDALLATAAAQHAAALPGVGLARVRAVLPTLDDAELSDLAARSQTLTCNPAAGSTGTRVVVGALVVLVVAYVVISLIAAGCVDNSQCLT